MGSDSMTFPLFPKGRAMRLIHWVVVAAILFPIPTFAAAPILPDAVRTPGRSDPTITSDNYRRYLCAGKKSKKLHTTDERRPTTAYTNDVKVRQLEEWDYTNKTKGAYEEDHLISLELGGDPKVEKNLWPQPYSGKWNARVKDTLEHELGERICLDEGEPDHISLRVARRVVTGDWITSYKKYVCSRTRRELTDLMKAQCK